MRGNIIKNLINFFTPKVEFTKGFTTSRSFQRKKKGRRKEKGKKAANMRTRGENCAWKIIASALSNSFQDFRDARVARESARVARETEIERVLRSRRGRRVKSSPFAQRAVSSAKMNKRATAFASA